MGKNLQDEIKGLLAKKKKKKIHVSVSAVKISLIQERGIPAWHSG